MMTKIICVHTDDFIENYLDNFESEVFYKNIDVITRLVIENYKKLKNKETVIINDIIITLDQLPERRIIYIGDANSQCQYSYRIFMNGSTSIEYVLMDEGNDDVVINYDGVYLDKPEATLISMTYKVWIENLEIKERSFKEYKNINQDSARFTVITPNIPAKYFSDGVNEVKSDDENIDLEKIKKDVDDFIYLIHP